MSSYALRCFVDAFGSNRTSIQAPLFLIPRLLEGKPGIPCGRRSQILQSSRQRTSITPVKLSVPHKHLYHSYLKPRIPAESRFLADSALHRDPIAWVRRLEPFLPPSLRNDKSAKIKKSDQGYASSPINKLPQLLQQARSNTSFEIDLLSYLGVQEGRWKAVVWLIKAISGSRHICTNAKNHSNRLLYVPQWAGSSPRLSDLTDTPVWADDLIEPLSGTSITLEKLTEPDKLNIDHENIGQIWRSVGHMILQAADRGLDDPSYSLILFHVFQILAHMHHMYAFPESIYKHNSLNDPFVAIKPPTLAILSARIMEVLSDATRRAHDTTTLSEATQNNIGHTYDKHDLTQATSQEQELGVGVWLDLLLWVCLEGGWITEAAWIINEIDKRRQDPDLKWSVYKWDSAHELMLLESARNLSMENVLAKSRVGEVAGGAGMSRHNKDTPSVNLNSRSISREVVLVLIDALVSTLTGTKSDSNNLELLEHRIGACKRLLTTESCDIDTSISNGIILRLAGSDSSNAMHSPETLDQIMQLSQTGENETPASLSGNSTKSLPCDFITPNSALRLGLLHQLLFCFSTADDIQGALRTFRRLQELRDLESQKNIKEFINKIQQSNKNPTEISEFKKVEVDDEAFLYQSPIPNYILAAFLDFVTRAELWDLAKWIIYSADADGPTVSPNLYSEPSMQPILIRFATATSDTQLLAKVTEKLKTPLSHSNLQALLHCQAALGNWNSVEELLSYFRDTPMMRWDASDAMKIATAVLYLEKNVSKADTLRQASLSQVMTILQKLLSGEYNASHGLVRDRDRSQILLMNQIGRILLDIPGKLSTLMLPQSILDRRVNVRVMIPTDAFNILLQSVVDCNGSTAGKTLWDQWCHDDEVKAIHRLKIEVSSTDLKQVVKPNLQTLRIITRPLVENQTSVRKIQGQTEISGNKLRRIEESFPTRAIKPQDVNQVPNEERKQLLMSDTAFITDADHSLLSWGYHMYKKFGLSDTEIEREIPKHLHPSNVDIPAVVHNAT